MRCCNLYAGRDPCLALDFSICDSGIACSFPRIESFAGATVAANETGSWTSELANVSTRRLKRRRRRRWYRFAIDKLNDASIMIHRRRRGKQGHACVFADSIEPPETRQVVLHVGPGTHCRCAARPGRGTEIPTVAWKDPIDLRHSMHWRPQPSLEQTALKPRTHTFVMVVACNRESEQVVAFALDFLIFRTDALKPLQRHGGHHRWLRAPTADHRHQILASVLFCVAPCAHPMTSNTTG
jgi:hypothetical protein